MDLGLKGLKAVVTGGTNGIGRAIAQTLAAEGAHVAFCARHADEVAQTVKDFAGHGVKISGRAVNVGDGPALAAWVNDVASEFGGIDLVVANVSALAIAADEAAWQRGFEVDMMGTVRLVNAAMPHLKRSAKASIVTISSVSGREIDFASGPYGTLSLIACDQKVCTCRNECRGMRYGGRGLEFEPAASSWVEADLQVRLSPDQLCSRELHNPFR